MLHLMCQSGVKINFSISEKFLFWLAWERRIKLRHIHLSYEHLPVFIFLFSVFLRLNCSVTKVRNLQFHVLSYHFQWVENLVNLFHDPLPSLPLCSLVQKESFSSRDSDTWQENRTEKNTVNICVGLKTTCVLFVRIFDLVLTS